MVLGHAALLTPVPKVGSGHDFGTHDRLAFVALPALHVYVLVWTAEAGM